MLVPSQVCETPCDNERRLPGGVDISLFPTPCFVINLAALERNLQVLDYVQQQTGAKILLALKGFAYYPAAPLIMKYLKGTTASGLHELMLGAQEFGGECHIYSPAYDERDIEDITRLATHMVFNTPRQWQRFRKYVEGKNIECSIRINPEYSEVEVPIYNPCYKHSRLGSTLAQLEGQDLEGITGLHFHTMCEQGAETLARTLDVIEAKFEKFLRKVKVINFGGGHHITRKDYNLSLLIDCIKRIQNRYGVEVYLEPGEAVALNAGILVASVLDTMHNDMPIAILDTSASTHMPDVIEMPYRPYIIDSAEPNVLPYTYRLGGLTCLAGDVIGDYSFDHELKPGDKLVFTDMAHYSMVKTNTFNGVKLASIGEYDPRTGHARIVKTFGYEDYKCRLG